ncbi:beta-glucosidase [Fusarium oxysporum Fo47]|uniref:beta-glucosidase n=1 Tax=Fusarium oxysporum Fo47 TaxID=660027 RepID=UPI002869A7D1|nr:beta-glucosidase [Fusarium oxysporum Fo47]WJG34377.1 beta-glucosidase [Fusarium oxysporum Fo47]
MDVEALIQQLTLEEKVQLTAGVGWWHTAAIERLSIPPIRLSDGPNGVRGTHFFDSTPSSCLPCGTALGATWNTDLIYRLGRLLSDEAHAKGAHVLLGPTVNIQRGPLGGRGFESFSEDPVLSGILAGHYVRGVQRNGVSATMKHFACNDMESARMAVDVQITERALREVYLLPFMIAVEMASPRVFMTAYNKVNGTHAPDNHHLLQDILRDEWKWDGLVVSDWFGTYSTTEAINAGQDLEMPGPTRWRGETLVHAVTSNKVKRSTLDERVRNILKLVKHSIENTSIPPNAPETQLQSEENSRLLREAAAESVVLLKNDKGVLPLDPAKPVAVIGPNADISTYCGGGSASLRAYHTVSPLEGIRGIAKDVSFTKGLYGHRSLPQIGKLLKTVGEQRQGFTLRIYNDPPPSSGPDTRKVLETRILDDSNIWFALQDTVELAKSVDQVVLCVGTSGEWESEGQDRENMSLPPGSDDLISAVLQVNPNTVVLIQSGTPVSMPWVDQASTIAQAWFGGNEAGNGIADVLFGAMNPSGKLPITMARRVSDNPSALSFRSEGGRVLYSEDVHVGYRWYDTLDIEPLFPFGHGLSYTTFTLSDLCVEEHGESESKKLIVSVNVTNTGSRSGAAVVQVYVKPPHPTPLTASALDTITRSSKELKGFAKINLVPGANGRARVELDVLRATSYWSEREDYWCSDAGDYTVLVGMSSRSGREKARQLSTRACDACRARRRKCVFPRDGAETASHCVGCSRLHIQCSFDIPTRPRGPKRRSYHALAARFGTRTATISHCSQMCIRLRPADYWDHISHRKWATAYCLSIGAFQVGQINQSRMFEAESMQLARLLGMHLVSEYEGLNPIETQLRKKSFWLQLYTFAHSKIQPGRCNYLTYLDNYIIRDVNFAALEPLNIVDENITETGIVGQLPSTPSVGLPNNTDSADDAPFHSTTVFIMASRAFLLGMRESMVNDGCNCGFGRSPEERLSKLRDLLDQLRYILDGLPTHMRQWGPGDNYQPFDSSDRRQGAFTEAHIEHLQNESTRANLHVSHLWLQNFLLDKMDVALQEMKDREGDDSYIATQLKQNWKDREDVSRQLLHILHSIPHAYLEPNGLYLIYKVRSIASSLLNCPFEMDRQLSRRVSEYIQEFTKVLSYLDRSEIVNTDGLRSWIDEGQHINHDT